MRSKYLLLLIVVAGFISCRKEKATISQPLPIPPTPGPVVAAVLLKDVVIPNLPSPYYHFEYNPDSTISVASYASDFRRYTTGFAGGKLSTMTNAIGTLNERLEYVYDNSGKVTTVNFINVQGMLDTKYILSYDGKKLVRLERQRKLGTDFIVNKVMTFSYYTDGNLREITDHRPAINGLQTEATTNDLFETSDTKVNVDGFSLLHNDFFDHLVLLPNVQLQKNNPGKEVFTSDANSYQVTYTYTYNERNYPMIKDGDMLVTGGTGTGQHFSTQSVFSYY